MAAIPIIPDALIGLTRRLTANEISIYMIDCGPGGLLQGQQEYYSSGNPGLAAYVFRLPSCVMDGDGLYTVTIYKANDIPAPDPQEVQDGGKKRRNRKRNTRRKH